MGCCAAPPGHLELSVCGVHLYEQNNNRKTERGKEGELSAVELEKEEAR